MMEFIFDTTRTVMGMALSGVLTRHPRLRLVVPHTGSAIPGVLDRAALAIAIHSVGENTEDTEKSIRQAAALIYPSVRRLEFKPLKHWRSRPWPMAAPPPHCPRLRRGQGSNFKRQQPIVRPNSENHAY